MNNSSLDLYSDIAARAEKKLKICKKYALEYLPEEKIELLIVGESPPIKNKYFYIPDDLNNQGLPARIFRVLFEADSNIDKARCELYLRKFQKRNYLLTDLCPYPIDCFTPPHRVEFINKEITPFGERIKKLRLSETCDMLLILPSGTFKELGKKKYYNIRALLGNLGFTDKNIIKWGDVEKHLSRYRQT